MTATDSRGAVVIGSGLGGLTAGGPLRASKGIRQPETAALEEAGRGAAR